MLSDADVAALYDVMNPWDPVNDPGDAFYHELVMAADKVLDVGCGTGSMLRYARAAGHTGRLVGLDPDIAALDRARLRTDIEWVVGVAGDASWDREFDLATMTSHAFQFLISDEELLASLLAICAALRDGGRFAFETRHPQSREWNEWVPTNASVVADGYGRALRVFYTVESVVDDVVTLTEHYADPDGSVLRTDRGRLRFLDVATLGRFLTDAGFVIDAQYGDWQRGAITEESREIITVARRA